MLFIIDLGKSLTVNDIHLKIYNFHRKYFKQFERFL